MVPLLGSHLGFSNQAALQEEQTPQESGVWFRNPQNRNVKVTL